MRPSLFMEQDYIEMSHIIFYCRPNDSCQITSRPFFLLFFILIHHPYLKQNLKKMISLSPQNKTLCFNLIGNEDPDPELTISSEI